MTDRLEQELRIISSVVFDSFGILEQIFLFLSAHDLLQSSEVNRRWKIAARSDSIWVKLVKDLWKEMIVYYDLFEIQNMNWDDIHVGLCGNSVRVRFVNSLIIFMKYVIFKSRNAGKLLTFNEF